MRNFLAGVAVAIIFAVLIVGFVITSMECNESGGRLMRAPWGSWECVK